MNKMQQQTMNSAPSMPLNLVSTEQIQKYLDENKNLIMAILESQNMGKVAECAQYQAILQKNLMYLAAIADAQPPGSSASSQPPTSSVAPQGESHVPQPQAAASPMQQHGLGGGGPVAKLPFQMNALRPQDQQHQLMQFQQQQQQQQMQQGQFSHGGGGANNGLHFLMQQQPGHGVGMMDFRGGQPGGLESNSGDGHGNLALGPGEGRD
ncbi:grf1-interacting factor 3 [Phtheirospermum japonicum]|uniref:Grf1-interacting factor 3 n=1 Tax=Phtheirospermum japonicum TaxID=374723 RepID=A0A830C3Q5_9LAMI|nr:grf1-interacting factor 3 [Phtheirospermum japonicum]